MLNDFNFSIPNSFTPNGDNVNDYFKVEGINAQSFNGSIYNRWGDLLFQWDNISASWDGKSKGELLPNGIYIAQVSIENKTEVKKIKVMVEH